MVSCPAPPCFSGMLLGACMRMLHLTIKMLHLCVTHVCSLSFSTYTVYIYMACQKTLLAMQCSFCAHSNTHARQVYLDSRLVELGSAAPDTDNCRRALFCNRSLFWGGPLQVPPWAPGRKTPKQKAATLEDPLLESCTWHISLQGTIQQI